MRHARSVASLVAVALVAGGAFSATSDAKDVSQSAIVRFDRPTWVTTAVLMGTYRIEHDDDRMTHGAPCTVVYRLGKRDASEVVSFYCIPRRQAAPRRFSTSVFVDPVDGSQTLTEYQFPHDPEVHGVPVVTLVRRGNRAGPESGSHAQQRTGNAIPD